MKAAQENRQREVSGEDGELLAGPLAGPAAGCAALDLSRRNKLVTAYEIDKPRAVTTRQQPVPLSVSRWGSRWV